METVEIRSPYEVGVLAQPAFDDAVAYGRALGLTVDVEHTGGRLIKRGWITVSGPEGALRQFLEAFRQVAG